MTDFQKSFFFSDLLLSLFLSVSLSLCLSVSIRKFLFLFQISFFVSGYAIPLFLIVILYLCMLKRLWHPVGNKISRESLKNKRRVTRLVLVIIVVFAVCWAPIQVNLRYHYIDYHILNYTNLESPGSFWSSSWFSQFFWPHSR
jgi:hypothetical protein